MLVDKRVYLASQSPRRRELLKQIGVSYEVLPLRSAPGRSDVIEVPNRGEMASDFAQRMASEKAASGWRAVEGRKLLGYPVLGADTVVEIDEVILGKPNGRAEAADMLRLLSGRSHWVHTAVAVQQSARQELRLSSSLVTFAALHEDELQRYLDSGEFAGKAGAYAIQGRAAQFVIRINGSYTGIMGLPLHDTAELLKDFGFVL
jgi:septum formation protein